MVSYAIIETTIENKLVSAVKNALRRAICGRPSRELHPDIVNMEGMSGRKYRYFVNELIGQVNDARYLEIGVWAGSTLCSAIYNNDVRALAIDNWSQFGGPAEQFFAALGRFKGKAAVSFLDQDFRTVDYSSIGKFNIYLFDGPHSESDHRDGIFLVQRAMEEQFVLIVDDWNWQSVRHGTFRAIEEAKVKLDFLAEIRTTLDDSHPTVSGAASDWHNGYFIAACSKGS